MNEIGANDPNSRQCKSFKDDIGCLVAHDLYISLREAKDIFIPNTISPFSTLTENRIWGMNIGSSLKLISANIYNKCGNQVFTTADLIAKWDATFQGKYVSQGVYVYIVKCLDESGNEVVKSGDVFVE